MNNIFDRKYSTKQLSDQLKIQCVWQFNAVFVLAVKEELLLRYVFFFIRLIKLIIRDSARLERKSIIQKLGLLSNGYCTTQTCIEIINYA